MTHDEYYAAILPLLAARSTCARRRVGAVIVDARGRVLSTGYNGPPSGIRHCTEVPCEGASDGTGDFERCEAVHAEVNAILQCSRLDLADAVYVSVTPCFACAKALANTPVRRVVALEWYGEGRGREILERAGKRVEVLGEEAA